MTHGIPPLPAVVSFIDRINHRDLDGFLSLMTDDHCLKVLDKPASCGKQRMQDAWRGYFSAFPAYLIYPERFSSKGDTVAVLGRTTGSHLGLADENELKLTLILVAEIRDGLVARSRTLGDTPKERAQFSLA